MEQYFFLYGLPFVEGFFITLFLLAAGLFLGRFWRLPVRQPLLLAVTELPRIGGIALTLGFLFIIFSVSFLSFPPSWWVFCGVLLVTMAFGLLDDYRALSWHTQLLWQISMGIILYIGGAHIFSFTHPLGGIWVVPNESLWSWGFLFFLGWCLLVVNTVNWVDGIDGLSGSIAFITYATFFGLALGPAVNQPPIAVLSAILMGCTLAFLTYNFPRARLFAGTSGVLFFGFTIFFLSVIAGTKIATALLVLALPILDALFVITKRFLGRKSVTRADTSHLHHVLLAHGWSSKKILALYVGVTLMVAVIALNTVALGKFVAILLTFFFLCLLLFHFHFPDFPYRRVVFWTGGMVLSGLVLAGLFLGFKSHSFVRIDDTLFILEKATRQEEWTQGLSNRESLCNTCGMLFEFPAAEVRQFWMKDMKFSIDVVWLDTTNKVVAKHEWLPFPSQQPFGPAAPVQRVVELPAGSAASIHVGDHLWFW